MAYLPSMGQGLLGQSDPMGYGSHLGAMSARQEAEMRYRNSRRQRENKKNGEMSVMEYYKLCQPGYNSDTGRDEMEEERLQNSMLGWTRDYEKRLNRLTKDPVVQKAFSLPVNTGRLYGIPTAQPIREFLQAQTDRWLEGVKI